MSTPLPQGFITQMRAQLGEEANAYFAALEAPYLRGLRLNPRKPVPPCVLEGMGASVPWNEALGRYLAQDSLLGATPLHDAGACYIQEPSAMAPVSVLRPQAGERVLDLCAAPGGKSTQIADALSGSGLLVCNEPVPSRAKILSRNIERMGVSNALVVSAEPEQLAPLWEGAFDAVLVDAPCSGEGMFRRHPETRAEWNEQSPAGCAARQLRILTCAARMLRAGGRLVYSTCTLNQEENERTVLRLMQAQSDLHTVAFSLPIGCGQALEAPDGMLHLYPHQVQGEGHFVALLQKAEAPDEADALFGPASKRLSAPQKSLLAAYDAFTRAFGEAGRTLPPANAQLGDALLCAPDLPPLNGIKVLRAGVQLGMLKGKVFAPDHALAMALPLPYQLPAVALNEADALRYQHGEALCVNEALKGYLLPTCHGLALGFGKAGGGQMKNHYPKGLRRP